MERWGLQHKAYKNFFRTPSVGFPQYKSKHKNHNAYTTNVVNGNIMDRDKNARNCEVEGSWL